MAVPSRDLGDLLVANGAQTLLLLPEVQEPALPFQPCGHVDVEAFFKMVRLSCKAQNRWDNRPLRPPID